MLAGFGPTRFDLPGQDAQIIRRDGDEKSKSNPLLQQEHYVVIHTLADRGNAANHGLTRLWERF